MKKKSTGLAGIENAWKSIGMNIASGFLKVGIVCVLFVAAAGAYATTQVIDKSTTLSSERAAADHNGQDIQNYEIVVPAEMRAIVKIRRTSLHTENCGGGLRVNFGDGNTTLTYDGNTVSRTLSAGRTTVRVEAYVGQVQQYQKYVGIVGPPGGQVPVYQWVYYDYYSCEGRYELDVEFEKLQPDLVVSSLSTDPSSQVVDNDPVNIDYTFRNAGLKAAGAFQVKLSMDGVEKQSFNCEGLSAGGSQTKRVELGKLNAGEHEFLVNVDAGDSVAETDESNNTKKLSIRVYKREEVSIEFDAHNGNELRIKKVMAGDKLPDLPEPERRGYDFAGWWTQETGGSQIEAGQKIVVAIMCHAHWTAHSSMLFFNNQGGSLSTSAVAAQFGSALSKVSVPTREGYAFAGYWTQANGGGVCYYDETGSGVRSWDIDLQAVTLYAKWIVQKSILSFDRQGGSGGASSVSGNYGEALPSISIPSRTGWRFSGYFTVSAGGGVQLYDATGKGKGVFPTSKTLYAYWEPALAAYSITLDGQSGSGGTESLSVAYGYTLPDVICPELQGYVFDGYFSRPNGDGTQYYDATGKGLVKWESVEQPMRVYAKWSKAYRVIFDANDGSGRRREMFFEKPDWQLAKNAFSRSGYVFAGWSMSADGVPCFADEDIVSRSLLGYGNDPECEPVVLYAIWGQRLQQTLFPGLNFITGGDKDGAEWIEEGSHLESSQRSGRSWLCTTVTSAGNLTYTMNWSASDIIDCSYSISSSSGFRTSQTAGTHGDSVDKGAHLAVWCADKKLSGCVYTDDATKLTALLQEKQDAYNTLREKIRNEAVYLVLKASIYFPEDSRKSALSAIDKAFTRCRQGYDYTPSDLKYLIENGLAAAGFNTKYFDSWSDSKNYNAMCDEEVKNIEDIDEIRRFLNSSLSVSGVKWSPSSENVTITYVETDVHALESGVLTTRSCVKGTSIGTLPEPPERVGYAFDGWWTEPIGGSQVSEETVFSTDTRLYMRWRVKSFTVKFNANGGSPETTRTVSYGQEVGELPNVSRAGYSSAGWFTVANGGNAVTRHMIVTKDMELYASWTKDTDLTEVCRVTFDANGGNISMSSKSVNLGATLGDLPTATRYGYEFLGWFTAEVGGTQVTAATVVTEYVTYYAHWQKVGEGETPYNPPIVPPEESVEPTKLTNTPPTLVAESGTYVDTAQGEVAPYAAAAAVYDGYLYDGDKVVGSVQVKVAKGKADKKSGVFSSKVTATVQTADGSKKISFKGGVADGTGRVTGLTAAGHTLDISLGVDGMGGAMDGKPVDGARNLFSAKDADSKSAAAAIEKKWVGAVNVVGDDIVLSVTIAKKGKVKVSGTVEGEKVSATSQLLVGAEACCVPVVITKKANLAFNLWLMADGTVEVRGADSVTSGEDAASPLWEAGKAGTLNAGAKFRMDGVVLSRALTGLYGDYLPNGVGVTQSGAKWVVAGGAKAGKLALVKGTSEIDSAKSKFTDNMSGLKLTYKAKDGSFKGSFKAYNLENGKIKSYTVNVTGVMIGAKGYGTATLKKPSCSFPITIE